MLKENYKFQRKTMEQFIRDKWSQIVSTGALVPPELRDFQVDLMALVIDGESVVVKVPTGAGKTLPLIFINAFTNG